MKRKFFLFFFLLSIFLCSCESDYSNFDVKINFTPSEYYNAEIRCVDQILPYYRGDFIEKLRHARKVKPSFVSESKTEEGQYQILLYKGEVCVGDYKVCGEDYLFDNQYDSFLECNNILNFNYKQNVRLMLNSLFKEVSLFFTTTTDYCRNYFMCKSRLFIYHFFIDDKNPVFRKSEP